MLGMNLVADDTGGMCAHQALQAQLWDQAWKR